MSDKISVLLDTDIGSDIDDAVALSYLLRQPRCELLGITTVSGDTRQRAACAEILCAEAGRLDIPIHCGAEQVLLLGPGQPEVPQYHAIKHRPHHLDRPLHTAVDFLRKTIRQRPGEITLLTIGPLTNIALLFAMDPEIPSLLKNHVAMAGEFFVQSERHFREWNILVDPVASAMVYSTPHKDFTSIGLDVTLQCALPAPEVRKKFQTKPLNIVLEMAQVWFQKVDRVIFHDPLAAAVIFEPGLCQYETGRVKVTVDADQEKSGATLFTSPASGPVSHRVAKSVDTAKFFKEYFGVFQ